MSDDRKEQAPEIHKVDTVPPPPDSDAYSAPTKVGEVSPATWSAMMLRSKASEGKIAAAPLAAAAVPKFDPVPEVDVDEAPAPASSIVPQSKSSVVPQIYSDDDPDEDNQETLLHPGAKPFSVPQPTAPPIRHTPVNLPSVAPPVPQLNVSSTSEAAWPFAPALVSSAEPTDTRRAVLLGMASFVVALVVFAAIVWLWL